ncbi:hypothetical protein AB0J57_05980 [Streptomyces sp. NPDC049837]|uniref:hypothetical protein n=1 Tax=Streptomyces sp. NPDC049837 TaxID=3155277 RepID=UPI0034379E41
MTMMTTEHCTVDPVAGGCVQAQCDDILATLALELARHIQAVAFDAEDTGRLDVTAEARAYDNEAALERAEAGPGCQSATGESPTGPRPATSRSATSRPTALCWPAQAQFTALRYFALDGTDHSTHKARSSMIRRYIIWRNENPIDKRLKALMTGLVLQRSLP